MKRAIAAFATICALSPLVAVGAPTPDPDTLKNALADPPSSAFVEADSTVKGEGPLDAQTFASLQTSDASRQQLLVNGLNSHGFVAGYGRVWAKKAAGIALVEQLLAFRDRSGALSYEGSSKLADTSSTSYKGSVDSSSVPDSYGVEELVSGVYTVAIVFVKGNDLIVAGFVSSSSYLVTDTVTQAEAEYAHAPAYTIQPSTSSPTADSAAYSIGRLAGGLVFGLLVIGVVLLVVGLVIRSRRRPALQAAGVPGMPVQMSPDGRFWWDGMTWQDASSVAPAHAQRSPDGAFWWDGRTWRPVPSQEVSHQ